MKGFEREQLNNKITPNFTYKEVLSSIFDERCLDINCKEVTPEQLHRAKKTAKDFLEPLREWINAKYQERNNGKEIGLGVTTWIRSEEYEKLKGRSGRSRHVTGEVADFYFLGVSDPMLYLLIFLDVTHAIAEDMDENGSEGGFSFILPEIRGGKIIKTGFIHRDFRGGLGVWRY